MKKALKVPPKEQEERKVNAFNIPLDVDELHKLADDLLTWTKCTKSLYIDEFAISRNISPFKMKQIREPYFEDKMEQALYIISIRREKSAAEDGMPIKIWEKTYPLYNKDYALYEDRKWKADYDTAKNIIVHMKDYSNER